MSRSMYVSDHVVVIRFSVVWRADGHSIDRRFIYSPEDCPPEIGVATLSCFLISVALLILTIVVSKRCMALPEAIAQEKIRSPGAPLSDLSHLTQNELALIVPHCRGEPILTADRCYSHYSSLNCACCCCRTSGLSGFALRLQSYPTANSHIRNRMLVSALSLDAILSYSSTCDRARDLTHLHNRQVAQ